MLSKNRCNIIPSKFFLINTFAWDRGLVLLRFFSFNSFHMASWWVCPPVNKTCIILSQWWREKWLNKSSRYNLLISWKKKRRSNQFLSEFEFFLQNKFQIIKILSIKIQKHKNTKEKLWRIYIILKWGRIFEV